MKGLLLVVFVNFVGIGALIPVLPYAVIDVAGGSETLMAFLMASFSLALFIGSPVLGALSDRLGRKRVLIGSIFVAAVAHAVFAFSTDLMMMFVARIVAGFAAGNLSVIMAIITDTTSQEERARWMGMLGAFVGLGFVAGPALGGLLSGVGGEVHTAPFMLAAVLALTGGIISQRTVEESAHATATEKIPFARRWNDFYGHGLIGFAIAMFLLNLGFAQVEVSFVLVLKDLLGYSSLDTGWIFTWIGLLIVVVQGGLIGPVSRWISDIGTALAGSLVLVLGQLATTIMIMMNFDAFGSSLISVLAVTALVCIGFAFTNPTLSSAASKRTSEGQIGGALGIVQGFGSLGQVGGLMVAGPIYEAYGGSFNFMAGGVISMGLSACILMIIIGRKTTR
jgi:MFS family permease